MGLSHLTSLGCERLLTYLSRSKTPSLQRNVRATPPSRQLTQIQRISAFLASVILVVRPFCYSRGITRVAEVGRSDSEMHDHGVTVVDRMCLLRLGLDGFPVVAIELIDPERARPLARIRHYHPTNL